MTKVFLGLIVAYLCLSLYQNRRDEDPGKERPSVPGYVIQSLLFLFACYYAWTTGVIGRELVHPGYIILGLIVGHIVFALSCVVTQGSLYYLKGHVLNLAPLRAFYKENPDLILRIGSIAFCEEIIYRVAAQPLAIEATSSALLGVLLVAVAFSVIHWHFFRNSVLESAEFVGFALLLGVLYYVTENLTFVVLVHAVRNLEIVFLEYLVELEETGDPEAAQAAIEREYAPRGMQQA
jgi:membrane protease YdiL (CAAX protease family)